ncbi:MAG: cytochrome C oxidase subunit I [Chitinophagaceae bacterium]|nr:cytochrome C oxidase subunit I [Chitinophagaceae bacterium]
MFAGVINNQPMQNTTYKVVLPFYTYAALSLFAACFLLLISTGSFTGHYFNPHILAITHMMALGWGTMIILGAGYQLIPVLIEKSLYSIKLANWSFFLAATGIPLLAYGFYNFDMGWPAKWGGRLVFISVSLFVINLAKSIQKSKNRNVHAWFMLAASVWLFVTALYGLVLVYNFTFPIYKRNHIELIPLHAHTGVIGWFLLLVIGVGSKLIPMFMISKYTNSKQLWLIFLLINTALVLFISLYIFKAANAIFFFPVVMLLTSLIVFAQYCYKSYKQRIRKQVDEQMKLSLLSLLMMLLPVAVIFFLIGLFVSGKEDMRIVLLYGFVIFFGWITAIIFGMTFKTLPFIVWNKVYGKIAGLGKTPGPKDLYSERLFAAMSVSYLAGFVIFIAGILTIEKVVLTIGSSLLLLSALLYCVNAGKLIFHKAF